MIGWLPERMLAMIGWLTERMWAMIGWLPESTWAMIGWLPERMWAMNGWLPERTWGRTCTTRVHGYRSHGDSKQLYLRNSYPNCRESFFRSYKTAL